MTKERIKGLREDRDLTQQQVADMLHISRSVYSNYENGYTPFPTDILIQLSHIYSTSIDYLLEQTDNPDSYREF